MKIGNVDIGGRETLYEGVLPTDQWRVTPDGGVLVKRGKFLFTISLNCVASDEAWEHAAEPEPGNYANVPNGKVWLFGSKLVFHPE